MIEKIYDRNAAVAYAHEWAYKRNPRYFDFSDLGGDCTNFASQVIYAGSKVMNYTPTMGWYYTDLYNRTAAWSGVKYLYNFLINNKWKGPFAEETDISQVKPGDIIQLSFDGENFVHSPVVVETGYIPSPDNILMAAHSYDIDYKPMYVYAYVKYRCLHIKGVNF
jgi:hypothetical protein